LTLLCQRLESIPRPDQSLSNVAERARLTMRGQEPSRVAFLPDQGKEGCLILHPKEVELPLALDLLQQPGIDMVSALLAGTKNTSGLNQGDRRTKRPN